MSCPECEELRQRFSEASSELEAERTQINSLMGGMVELTVMFDDATAELAAERAYALELRKALIEFAIEEHEQEDGSFLLHCCICHADCDRKEPLMHREGCALATKSGSPVTGHIPSVVRFNDDGTLDEVHGGDSGMEQMSNTSWFIYIGDVAVWLWSKSKIKASHERRQPTTPSSFNVTKE